MIAKLQTCVKQLHNLLMMCLSELYQNIHYHKNIPYFHELTINISHISEIE